MQAFCGFTGRKTDNGSDEGRGKWRDALTGFQNICRTKSQIFMMNISYQHSTLSLFLCVLMSFYVSQASIAHVNVHLILFSPSITFYVLYFSTTLHLPCVFVALAAIITSYVYLLLFHSITPSFLFTGPPLPFVPLLSSLSLFNSPLDVNCLLWQSFSISPSSFLISLSFVLRPCPILPLL